MGLENWLLGLHIFTPYACNLFGCLHGIAPERLAEFLVENYFDEGGYPVLHLLAYRGAKCFCQCIRVVYLVALDATSFSDFGIVNANVEFCADEVVVEP